MMLNVTATSKKDEKISQAASGCEVRSLDCNYCFAGRVAFFKIPHHLRGLA